jgi:hypothetical protein
VDIGAQDPRQAFLSQSYKGLNRVCDTQPRSEGERRRAQTRVDVRSNRIQDTSLHDSVADRWDVQVPLATVFVGDHELGQIMGRVRAVSEFSLQQRQATLVITSEAGNGTRLLAIVHVVLEDVLPCQFQALEAGRLSVETSHGEESTRPGGVSGRLRLPGAAQPGDAQTLGLG